MPFTQADVEKHIKGLTGQQKAAWVRIANRTLSDCDDSPQVCEGRAIRIANDAARKVGEHYELWNDDELVENLIRSTAQRLGEMDIRKALIQEEVFDRGVAFREAKVNGNLIANVKLLGKLSKNKRIYSDAALNDAARLYAGARFYLDHPTDRELRDRKGTRSVHDLAGRIVNPRRVGDEVRGDIQLLDRGDLTKLVTSIAEQMPDIAGMSHRAQGRIKRDGEQDIVEGIDEVAAVELVADPATTNGLFESLTHDDDTEEVDMKELTIEKLRNERPDLVEQIETAVKEGSEIETLREENKDLKAKVEKLELVESEREREAEIDEKLKAADLPDRLVTDLFRAQLREAKDDEAIDALIAERKEIARGLKTVGPRSTERDFDRKKDKKPLAEATVDVETVLGG